MSAVEFDAVSIVFGDAPETALPLMDEGKERTEIQRETGQVLGVHDCTLAVEQGEILVLMGLSGSGKSTLLRAVNALNPVVRGEVRLRDGDQMVSVTQAGSATLRRLRRRSVAMVFQQFGLLPWRTVRDNVGFGLELEGMARAERREKVDHQLQLVGLSDRANALVGELSGGMQQRVGLARAFATEAPILLMDEPFSALDPLIRTRLQDELLDLQARLGKTIIFVSHDLDEAFKIGNRIAIMEGGRIVQSGTPREIFSHPANDYVAEFVANMNPLGVLRARDVMIDGQGGPQIDAELPVADVIARLGAGATLTVTEKGTAIGQVTEASVLRRLSGTQDEGAILTKEDFLDPLPAIWPGFQALRDDFERKYADSADDIPDYILVGDLVRACAGLLKDGQEAELTGIFDLVDRWIAQGDNYVRTIAITGFIEDMTNRNMHTDTRPEDFERFLGPRSTRYWEVSAPPVAD